MTKQSENTNEEVHLPLNTIGKIAKSVGVARMGNPARIMFRDYLEQYAKLLAKECIVVANDSKRTTVQDIDIPLAASVVNKKLCESE